MAYPLRCALLLTMVDYYMSEWGLKDKPATAYSPLQRQHIGNEIYSEQITKVRTFVLQHPYVPAH
jgi:hypothetical protein